jgi:hypothetical protein
MKSWQERGMLLAVRLSGRFLVEQGQELARMGVEGVKGIPTTQIHTRADARSNVAAGVKMPLVPLVPKISVW